jgi:hypothetical protein
MSVGAQNPASFRVVGNIQIGHGFEYTSGTAQMKKEKTARQILDAAMTETELENAAREIAQTLGFMVFHPQKSLRLDPKSGKTYHLTSYKGDKGFPDWVYAKDGKVLFVEYKMEGKYPDPDQRKWLAALGDLGRLWRPGDLSSGVIEKTLRSLS